MNTITRDCLTETNHYDDEVLNANWLPQMVLAVLGLQTTRAQPHLTAPPSSEREAEEFLQRLYRAQE